MKLHKRIPKRMTTCLDHFESGLFQAVNLKVLCHICILNLILELIIQFKLL